MFFFYQCIIPSNHILKIHSFCIASRRGVYLVLHSLANSFKKNIARLQMAASNTSNGF